MHAAVVGLSELHEAVFADHMTRTFGVSWEAREMGRDRNPAWAIAEYVAAHGRRPTPAAIMKLRAQATLATRPEKQVRSLADLTDEWRSRATKTLGRDVSTWAREIVDNDNPLLPDSSR